MKPAGVKLTWDDYMLFPEDGMRHALIDGEHYVTRAPFLRHQEIVGRLFLAIGNYLVGHPIGRVFVAPLDVIYRRADDPFGRPADCRAALATCSPRNCCRNWKSRWIPFFASRLGTKPIYLSATKPVHHSGLRPTARS
jgi:Putative restriction endonuclease